MPRYFIEVSYKGTNYSGFQVQQNANSIQAEVEKALKIYYKEDFKLTGSSRTDAGVHAIQNFFHFDSEQAIEDQSYHLNAILPKDIVICRVVSNRFLRGMVRGMVGTMLQVGREKISVEQFVHIIQSRDCTKADFSVPPLGLFLQRVNFPCF